MVINIIRNEKSNIKVALTYIAVEVLIKEYHWKELLIILGHSVA